MSRFLDFNPFSGSISTFDYDEMTDTITIKRKADVTANIDFNHQLASLNGGWVDPGHTMACVARIPIELAYKWLVEKGVSVWKAEHRPAVLKLLNDAEYDRLRVWRGRV